MDNCIPIRDWVARSSTSRERLLPTYEPGAEVLQIVNSIEPVPSEIEIKSVVDAWCGSLAGGDRRRFEQALLWDGIPLDRLVHLVRPHKMAEGSELPGWADVLATCLEKLGPNSLTTVGNLCGPGEESIPFQEIWAEFSRVACILLSQRLSGILGIPHESVFAALRDDLTTCLSSVAVRALYASFSGYRVSGLTGQSASPFSSKRYLSFCQDLLNSRCIDLFNEYPVLARFVGTFIEQWLKTSELFLRRLDRDYIEIRRLIGCSETSEITSVTTGLSDRHRGGQRCIKVEFEQDKGVIYKPRPIVCEQLYGNVIDRFLAPEVRRPKSPLRLAREEYGWEEKVEESSCRLEQEVHDYFELAGAHLFFMYLLGGSDFHRENVIATASGPVVIDLEGIAAHLPFESPVLQIAGMGAVTSQYFAHSVLRSALLPLQILHADNVGCDVGGFPARYDVPGLEYRTRWKNSGTDAIRPVRELVQVSHPRNQLRLNGELINPLSYSDRLRDGFARQYRYFMEQRLAEPFINSVDEAEEFSSRFIVRDTAIYAELTEKLLTPQCLRSGVTTGIALEVLGRMHALGLDTPGPDWRIVESERRQLLAFDAPLFETRLKGLDLFSSDGDLIQGVFEQSAFQQISDRVHSLSERDLSTQLQLISISYSMMDPASDLVCSNEGCVRECEDESEDFIVDTVDRIASLLIQRSVQSNDGSINWLGIATQPHGNVRSLEPMAPQLYDGYLGPALFLAALGIMQSKDEYCTLAKQTTTSLHELASNQRYIRSLIRGGIGLYCGIGSVLCGLGHLGQITRDLYYKDLATRLLYTVSDEMLRQSNQVDLTSGIAGLVVLLSRFSKEWDSEDSLVLAEDFLVTNFSEILSKLKSQTGIAHGYSGLALACAELFKVTGNLKHLERAEQILLLEDRAFDQALGNWRDSIEADTPSVFTRWCHGGPGILLARSRISVLVEGRMSVPSMSLVENLLLHYDPEPFSTLCCGSAGVADVCFEVGRQMSSVQLVHKGRGLLRMAVRSRMDLQPHAGALSDRFIDFGFFQGLTGVGYAMLRQVCDRLHESEWLNKQTSLLAPPVMIYSYYKDTDKY